MHIVMLVAFGLMALAIFVIVSRLAGGGGAGAGAPRLFIWTWLVASLFNGAVGVFSAGIPLVSEVAAFVPIFGIPAAVAYAIIRTQRRVGGGEPQTPGA